MRLRELLTTSKVTSNRLFAWSPKSDLCPALHGHPPGFAAASSSMFRFDVEFPLSCPDSRTKFVFWQRQSISDFAAQGKKHTFQSLLPQRLNGTFSVSWSAVSACAVHSHHSSHHPTSPSNICFVTVHQGGERQPSLEQLRIFLSPRFAEAESDIRNACPMKSCWNSAEHEANEARKANTKTISTKSPTKNNNKKV